VGRQGCQACSHRYSDRIVITHGGGSAVTARHCAVNAKGVLTTRQAAKNAAQGKPRIENKHEDQQMKSESTVAMYREDLGANGGPTTADVHVNEVEMMQSFGWRIADVKDTSPFPKEEESDMGYSKPKPKPKK